MPDEQTHRGRGGSDVTEVNEAALTLMVQEKVNSYVNHHARLIGIPAAAVIVASLIGSFFWFQEIAADKAAGIASDEIAAWRQQNDIAEIEALSVELRRKIEQGVGQLQEITRDIDATRELADEAREAIASVRSKAEIVDLTRVNEVLTTLEQFDSESELLQGVQRNLGKLADLQERLDATQGIVEQVKSGDLQLPLVRARRVLIENSENVTVAKLGTNTDGDGDLMLYTDTGQRRARLTITTGDNGVLVLHDSEDSESARVDARPDGGSFRVRNGDVTVARMGNSVNGHGSLHVYSPEGQVRAWLSTSTEGQGDLQLFNTDNTQSVRMHARKTGAALLIKNSGTIVADYGTRAGEGSVRLYNVSGQPRVELAIDTGDNGGLWVTDVEGAEQRK